MLALLEKISTPMLLIAGFVIVVLNTLFLRWFLGKIQAEPIEEPEAEEAPAAETTNEGGEA